MYQLLAQSIHASNTITIARNSFDRFVTRSPLPTRYNLWAGGLEDVLGLQRTIMRTYLAVTWTCHSLLSSRKKRINVRRRLQTRLNSGHTETDFCRESNAVGCRHRTMAMWVYDQVPPRVVMNFEHFTRHSRQFETRFRTTTINQNTATCLESIEVSGLTK